MTDEQERQADEAARAIRATMNTRATGPDTASRPKRPS